jgi:hypothetical protein
MMSDPVWYYARGESEQGPISTAQIKALAAAGALKRDDLVWKEGMENWLPAGEVNELYPAAEPKKNSKEKATPTPETSAPAAGPRPRQRFLVEEADLKQHVSNVGRGLIVFGVLMVLMSRGCDSLGQRKIARLKAISDSSEAQFQREWERAKARLEDEQLALSEKQDRSEGEQARMQRIPEEIATLDNTKRSEQRELRQGRWRDYQVAAETAATSNQIGSYWRRLAFLFGTMALAIGLLAVTPTTEGPERWICLVMLIVILYSVYSSGSVWDGAP